MKLLIALCLLILAVSVFSLVNLVQASNTLRDFEDTEELEQFLSDVPWRIALPEKDQCVRYVEMLISTGKEMGYRLDRFAIASNDYYRFWYNADLPIWEGHQGLRYRHGVALARVNGKDYLVEPLVPMGWELTVPYAGQKVGVSWQ